MPIAKIKTSLIGSIELCYNIATPTNPCAKSIDKNLPTIIFLHPVYLSSPIFHFQLLDPHLRKFNCVTFDARGHGGSTVKIPKSYGPAQAADDAVKLMDVLKIPKAHICGVSMGSLTSMHMAISFPSRCLSVYLISPMAIQEPEEVFAGREEIAEYWEEGYNGNADAHQDAVYGALQLAFSNDMTGLAQTLLMYELPGTTKRWSAKNIAEYRTSTLDIFRADRDLYSKQGFSRIKCPVKLMFCSEDIAFSLENATDLLELMQDSGVQTSLEQVPACHYGNVKKPAEINESLVRFLGEVEPKMAGLSVSSEAVVSPFEEALKEAGYVAEDEDE